jgi:photosystem I P700 chlorophyll a apoprotein A2
MRTNQDLYVASVFLLIVSLALLQAGWLHLQPQFKPSIAWFKITNHV